MATATTPVTATPTHERTPGLTAPVQVPTFPAHRLTVERVERMLAAGVFTEKDPVFLWKGRLVEKMTKGRPHTIALGNVLRAIAAVLPAGYHAEQEASLALSGHSLPEPDVMVLRGRLADYPDKHPTVADLLLLVEVADSSLAVDEGDALQTYAAENVPIYWVVNVPGRTIDVYESPSGPAAGGAPGYASSRRYEAGESVPLALDGREAGRIAVNDVFP